MRLFRASVRLSTFTLGVCLLAACGTYRPKSLAEQAGPDSGVPVSGIDGGTSDGGPSGGDGGPDGGPVWACTNENAPDGGNAGGDWLHTRCNKILKSNDTPWMARGANLPDTRGCGACVNDAPSATEVNRRLDQLTDGWGATLVRIDLEAYQAANGKRQWQGLLEDPTYFADLKTIVAHAASKPGVYVVLSPWLDPTQDSQGWPTAQSRATLQALAEAFQDQPRVILAVAAQPHDNLDGAQDPQAWAAMDAAVAAIRATEDRLGKPHHLVAVPGLGAWGRRLDYFLSHPIAAGGGGNVLYEVHAWDPAEAFEERFVHPATILPVIIGEFGPATVFGGTMSDADAAALMARADALGIPWLTWTFHMRCEPSLLVDRSANTCGLNMELLPTAWGAIVRDQLAKTRSGP